MQQFDTWAREAACLHLLFLFDSCFSGSVFMLRGGSEPPEHINYKTAEPVRQFITAGKEDESVLDNSIFRPQLESALRDSEADLDHDGYVSGTELGTFLQDAVIDFSGGTQHPQHGKIRDPDLSKGDFVFQVARTNPAARVTTTPPLQTGENGIVVGTNPPKPPSQQHPTPPPPEPPTEYSASPILGGDFGAFSNGGTMGFEFETVGLEAGINIQSSKSLYLNIFAEAGSGYGIDGFSYYYGGRVEVQVLARLLIGIGGGMAGGLNTSLFPYIRGTWTLFDDGTWWAIKLYYDYGFENHFRVGVLWNAFVILD
jgi:hypothetical protein